MKKDNLKELILYVVFGALTTLINIISYNLLYYVAHIANVPANIIAWILSVAFAYFTNRAWVFEKSNKNALKEATEFVSARLFTGLLDLLIMFLFVDVLKWEAGIIKVASNVLVIILNYLLSKLWIFKK